MKRIHSYGLLALLVVVGTVIFITFFRISTSNLEDIFPLQNPVHIAMDEAQKRISNPTAKAPIYQTVVNPRYGFSFAIPKDWVGSLGSLKGDSMTYDAKDQAAKVTVSGNSIRNMNQALQHDYQLAKEQAQKSGTITLDEVQDNYFALSWDTQTQRVYVKGYYGTASSNVMRMYYTLSEQAIWAPVMEQVIESFKPGDLSQVRK